MFRAMFRDHYEMIMPAEERGYIPIASVGYGVDGGYGEFRQKPLTRRDLREEDVWE